MKRRYVVPGRVELAGKHVDYAGGRSLTCAVDLAITALAQPLDKPVLRVTDAERGTIELPIVARDSRAKGMPLWATYASAVARRFARDFPYARKGVHVKLRSALPPSAGLSSSSALIVTLAMALADANSMEQDERWTAAIPDTLARAEYFSAMETGASHGAFPGDDGVGVRGGAQDPIAIMCAREGSIGQFSYLPARIERRVPWPADHVLVIGVSGVHATKTGNARERYNRASDATRDLLIAWNASTARNDHTLMSALESGPDAPGHLAHIASRGTTHFDDAVLVPRLAQFREEVEIIVPHAAEALGAGALALFGTLMDRSQRLAEEALGNQVPETIHLATSAREIGAVAASAFGAGFGGSVWAMVEAERAATFVEEWRGSYERAHPERAKQARWVTVSPGAPAREIAADE